MATEQVACSGKWRIWKAREQDTGCAERPEHLRLSGICSHRTNGAQCDERAQAGEENGAKTETAATFAIRAVILGGFERKITKKGLNHMTRVKAVATNKPAAKKVAVPTKKASVLAREAQAAKKRLLKLRADTKKAIEAAKREVAKAAEAARAAARFEKQAAKDKAAAKKAKATGAKATASKVAAKKPAAKKAVPDNKVAAKKAASEKAVKAVTKKRAPAKKAIAPVASPETAA